MPPETLTTTCRTTVVGVLLWVESLGLSRISSLGTFALNLPEADMRRYRVPALVLAFVAFAGLAVMLLPKPNRGRDPLSPADAREEETMPAPRTSGGMPLADVLARRRSGREFAPGQLAPEQVSQLCWAAQGVTDPTQGYRTAPSAGALFPITLYVVDRGSVFEYHPGRHVLTRLRDGDCRDQLQSAALGQPCVGAAPVCLVIAMDVGRSASKYGHSAERYCLLEAGHVAQNVLLQATALGLVGVPVGAFDDRAITTLLRLPPNREPVYLLPIGHPPAP